MVDFGAMTGQSTNKTTDLMLCSPLLQLHRKLGTTDCTGTNCPNHAIYKFISMFCNIAMNQQ